MKDKLMLKLFERTIENLRLGVTITDLDRNILYVNKADAEMHGYTQEELRGKDAIIYSSDKDHEKANSKEIQNWKGMMREVEQKRKDGSTFPARLISNTIRDENKEPMAVVTICEDVTKLSEMEEELRKAKQLEDFRLLTAGVAHDCNNIIGRLLNGIEIGKQKIEQGKNMAPILDFLQENTKRARDILDSLFAFRKKKGDLSKEAIAVKQFLREIVQFEIKDKNIECDFNIDEGLPYIGVDASQIRQVIHNIIRNAFEAMEYDGKIEIGGEKVNEISEKEIKGEYVKLSFKDYGEGIKEENIDRIFEPLFTTKKTGNGVGLALAKLIVDYHEGHIRVDSTYGKGSTFYVYLPVTKKAERPEHKDEEVEIKLEKLKNKKILFVEDDEVLVNTFSDLLNQYDIIVDYAETGEMALEKFKKKKHSGDDYDFLIIDLNLKGSMNGEKVMEEIIEADGRDCLAIATTGDRSHQVLKKYKSYGFTATITKPFTSNDILKLLSEVVD